MQEEKKEKSKTDKSKSGDSPAPAFKQLVIHTAKYKTLLTTKYENRVPYQAPDFRLVKSFIPGTIIKVTAKPGQKVRKGDPMLILEAMKMENKITFPFDGVVSKVHVKAGDRIPKGFLMVEYESIK